MSEQPLGTVVIGGSQAGLAVGYHLARRGQPFIVLDQHERVGDAWRKRWDSLRLFTPVRYCHLPGMRFPGPRMHYPGKDEVADYLETYARKFELPVRTGARVDRVTKVGDHFEVDAGDEVLEAENVVVATGAYHHPRVPPFARELDPGITQLHSKEYRNPSQVREGGVLVVGAGNSGAEIAVELGAEHRTWLAGPDTGEAPTRTGSLADRLFMPLRWLVATRFTVNTPPGRKLRDHFLDPPRGIPLGRVRQQDFTDAGIERVARVTGVSNGLPVLEDGTVLEVANVIWCTGFRTDHDWIDIRFHRRPHRPTRRRRPMAAPARHEYAWRGTGGSGPGRSGSGNVVRVLANAVAVQRDGVALERGFHDRARGLLPYVEHADRDARHGKGRLAHRRLELVELVLPGPAFAPHRGVAEEPDQGRARIQDPAEMLRDDLDRLVARERGPDDRQPALLDELLGPPPACTEGLQRSLRVFDNAEDHAVIAATKPELKEAERPLELGLALVEVRNVVTRVYRFLGNAELHGLTELPVGFHSV